ncbi:MAG: glycine betaine/proline transport system substrate-binding protein [Actinomycetota bacterium]|nr:glycine betaine/proline transport system substrate-binding protein [Actinomycetota bacterium]
MRTFRTHPSGTTLPGAPRRPSLHVRILGGLVLLATLTGLVSGCGSSAPAIIPPPTRQVNPACGTVTLAVNPWAGYEANVAVISYLARHKLGCKVVLKEDKEETSWKQLAEGSVDAIVENWGHDELKKRYIDREQLLVEGGLTGNKGIIGWYVPPWMVEKYPDITNWRNLNKYAYLFRTQSSGGKGQLLDGDPTYVTNDKDLVRNLKLDFTVVYSGSEDNLIKAFRKAEREKTPLLGYFYAPQWLFSELALGHVSLPPYTPGCDASSTTVVCDYQPYDLDKIMNKDFALSGSPAAYLIENFSWTDADQNQVAYDIAHRRRTPDQAAERWVKNHQETWKEWLPPKK